MPKRASARDVAESITRVFKRARKSAAKASSMRAKSVSMSRMNSTTIRRSIAQSGTLNQSVGWVGVLSSGFDVCIAPTLQNCSFIIGGTTSFQPLLPNASELTNLYDQYRIRKISVEVFFSASEHGLGTPSTSIPLIHYVNDYNSVASFNLTDLNQYPDVKTRQLGNNRPIKWSFVPRVRADVLTQGGVISTSAFSTSGWIDTSSPSVEHLGSRFFIDFQGNGSNTDVGKMTVIVRYDIDLRLVK